MRLEFQKGIGWFVLCEDRVLSGPYKTRGAAQRWLDSRAY